MNKNKQLYIHPTVAPSNNKKESDSGDLTSELTRKNFIKTYTGLALSSTLFIKKYIYRICTDSNIFLLL